MHIVTGGAGFIGSNVVRVLNEGGIEDILVVDAEDHPGRDANLAGRTITDYVGIDAFRKQIESGAFSAPVAAVLHQGACADTMETDRDFMYDRNVDFSTRLLQFALDRKIPFVYASSASVYGVNRASAETPENESPLNVYAESKLAFDNYVRPLLSDIATTVVGLRYFNVYGPHERSKGRMASMVYQTYRQIADTGEVKLFTGTEGFGDGEQARDFVSADDCVAVNLFFAEGPPRQGIVNVGTGKARSFNDVARVTIETLGGGEIRYIPFPDKLRGKYQSFTESNPDRLRAAGYEKTFAPIEDGIPAAIRAWQEEDAAASR